jgi:hypothetical protein
MLIIVRVGPAKIIEGLSHFEIFWWFFLWGGGHFFLACIDLGLTKDFSWFLNFSKTSSILYVVIIFSVVNPQTKQIYNVK